MKVLVTGLRGTVGRALEQRLRPEAEVIGWDRAAVPIDRYDVMDAHVARVAPDAIVNLAIASQLTGRHDEPWHVNHELPSELAWICRQRKIRFVHASTVMVFASAGPFTVASVPDAPHGYGGNKRQAEQRVRYQNPDAVILRIGWQIGDAPGSNNMVDFLDRQVREHGHITASARFFPACSFLADTADAFARALHVEPGLYMVDANHGWSFADIARALAEPRGWHVEVNDDFVRDERMLDRRLPVASLAERLPSLAAIAPVPSS